MKKERSAPKAAAPKKTTLSPKEFRQQAPAPQDIQEGAKGGYHIPILALENSLDFFRWGTSNFQWQFYNDGRRRQGVSASLILILHYPNEKGVEVADHFVGACNFWVDSIAPIEDFLATAKSLCIKNAATDAGRKFGRGLNEEVMPKITAAAIQNASEKMKPDKGILESYRKAIANEDDIQKAILENIYVFETEDNEQTTRQEG